MHPAARLLPLLVLLALCAACATPQKFPASVVKARVLDAESGAPVPGAKVTMRYVPPSGDSHSSGEYVTDAEGKVTMDLPTQRLPSGFGAVYFAGGYWRALHVEAKGYEEASFPEGPHYGLFERQFSQLSLKRSKAPPPRNQFGAVRSLGVTRFPGDSKRIFVDFELLEGPRAGTRFRVPMFAIQRDWFKPGTRFYLKRSLEEVEEWVVGKGKDGVLHQYFLRDAEEDEPYDPVIPPPSG